MSEEKVNKVVINEVKFDQELYERNLKENDFSPKETYEGKDGKGVDEE
ncbi:MAG: hypothetical protein ABS911_09625 [Carnobacterium sp.]